MKDLRLGNLYTWHKVSKAIGLLSFVTSIGYASLKLGSPDFEFGIAATLVLTGVCAVFAGNFISVRLMKLESDQKQSLV